MRSIFRDYVEGNLSMRQISWQLNQERILSPSGKAVWGVSTIGRLIRNEAYVGRTYYNRTTSTSGHHPAKRARQTRRPRDQWIPIAAPAIVSEELFEAAQRVSYDNSKWSPRRAEPDHWLLRGLIKCGHCRVGVSCHKMRGRNGTFHYYYYCTNHDPLRAGGEHRRCPERNIRADELDAFVFDQVRTAMLRPDVLLSGAAAVSTQRDPGGDELVATQVARLDHKLNSVATERRRLADLYQANFIEREELLRRGRELELRRTALEAQRRALIDQREQLAHHNRLRERVEGFANKVRASIDRLDFDQRQKLLRLMVDEVRVSGWQVEIRLRIPLDSPLSRQTRGCPPKTVCVPFMSADLHPARHDSIRRRHAALRGVHWNRCPATSGSNPPCCLMAECYRVFGCRRIASSHSLVRPKGPFLGAGLPSDRASRAGLVQDAACGTGV